MIDVEALVGTTAALAICWPAAKLRIETGGTAPPVGQAVRNPGAVGPVTVKFKETARADAGIPQMPESA